MNNKIGFFSSKISFLSFGFYLMFSKVSQNAWVSIIIGTLLGAFIIYLFSLLKKIVNNNVNKELKKHKILNIIYKLIFILIYAYFIILTLVLLPLFVNTFYLVNTPKIITIIPFFLVSMYVASKPKNILFKLSNILFFLSIVIIILTTFLSIKYFDFSVLLPILDVTKLNMLESILIYASLSAIPSILTINIKNNFKQELKLYLFTSFIILSICLTTILMLDHTLLNVYSFPAYTVLKRIKILKFIEHIENFISFIWYFDFMITLSISLSNFKDTINNKLIYYISSIIIVIFTVYFLDMNYQYLKVFIDIVYLVLYGFLFLIILLLIILKVKKTRSIKSI